MTKDNSMYFEIHNDMKYKIWVGQADVRFILLFKNYNH